MFSVRDLKDSINERLSAAVVEIVNVFQQTIDKCDDDIHRRRRLLDNSWTRPIQTHNSVFPQHRVCKEETLFEQQLNNQDLKSNFIQEELELRQVKMEQEEHCTSEDAEKLSIKLESDINFETPAGHSDEQLYCKALIGQKLTAATKQISTVFEKSISQFEEERRLMEIFWQPRVRLCRAERSQEHVCEEEKEEVLFGPQLNNQEQLQPRQAKVEPEELCTTQIAEKLAIKLESEIVLETPPAGHSDEQLYCKELIGQRLTAAIKQISTVFEKSISQFEEERRLMEISWQPRVRLCRAERSQQYICKEEKEEVLFGLQLNNQEQLQAKVEQEELCTTQIAEKLAIKLESEIVSETPAGQSDEQPNYNCVKELIGQRLTAAVKEISTVFEKSISRFEEERRLMEIFWQPRVRLCRAELSQRHVCKEEKEEECLPMKQGLPSFIATQTCEESNSETLLSHSSSVNESQEQTGSEGVGSGSRNADMKAMPTVLKTRYDAVTEKLDFKCGICGKLFQTKVVLKRHCKIHTYKSSEKCDICAKTFVSKEYFKRHHKFHTSEKPYSCKTCGKRFDQQGNLSVHTRIHTGEKPYSCKTCGKSFTQQGNFSVHLRTHTGEKPYLCETCGKRFVYPTHLKSHMRVHSNVKLFSCEECGGSFRHKRTWIHHMEIHAGKRRHTCEKCQKGFRDASCLSSHMKRHSGEKPYSCNMCSHRFTLLTDLQRHSVRAHVAKNSYSCVTCARSFSEKKSLLHHMKSHTGE